MRLSVMLHPPATAKIKHPCRNLQHWKSAQLIPHTAQNCLAASLRLALHPYPLTVPRVPAIQHFALLTFMGALCLSYIMRVALTDLSVTGRPASSPVRSRLAAI